MSLRKGFITYIDISNPLPPPPTNYTLYMNIQYTSSHIQATNQTPTTQDIFGNNDFPNAVLLPVNGNITINIITAYVTSTSITGNPYPVLCDDDVTSKVCQDTTTNTNIYILVMKEYNSSLSLLTTHTISVSPYIFTPNTNTKYIIFTWQYQNTTSVTTTNCDDCKLPLKLYMNPASNSLDEIVVSSWGTVSVFGNNTSSNPKYLFYNGTSVTIVSASALGATNLTIKQKNGVTLLVSTTLPFPIASYTFSLHPNTTDIEFTFT